MNLALLCALASVTHLKPQGCASAALPPMTMMTLAFLMSTQWLVIAPRPNVGAKTGHRRSVSDTGLIVERQDAECCGPTLWVM